MKVSKEARKGARSLYQVSFSNGRLDSVKVKDVVSGIRSRKPAGAAQILHEYHRLVRLEVDRRTAVVESAVSLPHSEEQKIEAVVKERLGNDVRAEFLIHSELIAGVRIRIGSHVYETSIRERLSRLKWDLAH